MLLLEMAMAEVNQTPENMNKHKITGNNLRRLLSAFSKSVSTLNLPLLHGMFRTLSSTKTTTYGACGTDASLRAITNLRYALDQYI